MSDPRLLNGAQLAALICRSSAQRAVVLLAIDHPGALPPAPRRALLGEARGWLTDCGWSVDVDDARVHTLVHRRYDGGWLDFVVAKVDLLEVTPTS